MLLKWLTWYWQWLKCSLSYLILFIVTLVQYINWIDMILAVIKVFFVIPYTIHCYFSSIYQLVCVTAYSKSHCEYPSNGTPYICVWCTRKCVYGPIQTTRESAYHLCRWHTSTLDNNSLSPWLRYCSHGWQIWEYCSCKSVNISYMFVFLIICDTEGHGYANFLTHW